MGYDLVEHLLDLPYLVVAEIFPLLPVATVNLYCSCDSYEVRQLARLRRWQEVIVGHQLDDRHYVLEEVLGRMVKADRPPPYPIQSLEVALRRDNHEQVAQWSDYLARHAATVHLKVPANSNQFLSARVPLFDTMPNLRSLTFLHGLGDYIAEHPLEDLRFPAQLRTLLIGEREMGSVPYRDLVVPLTLTELRLRCLHESPEDFPKLPATLRRLVLWGVEAVDFSPFVLYLPRGLVELEADRTDIYRARRTVRRCGVLTAAAKHLPPLLQRHNLYVVDDVKNTGYMHQKDDGGWQLVLDDYTDYAKYQPPQEVTALEIRAEGHAAPKGYLPHVVLRLPALTQLLANLLAIGRCRLLPQLVPCLTELLLHLCRELSKCDWGFIVNLTKVSMSNCCLRSVPAVISKCRQLEELDLACNDIYVGGLGSSTFPLSLRRLVLAHSNGNPPKANKRQRTDNGAASTEPPALSFATLTRLEHLDIRRCKLKGLAIEFPDSLKELHLLGNTFSKARLEEVVFPPALEELNLESSGIRRPWNLVLPDSIQTLNLLRNALVPPPRGYEYPAALTAIELRNCGIKDLTKFPLPLLLHRASLEWNEFPAPKAYAWPEGLVRLLVGEDEAEALRAASPHTTFERINTVRVAHFDF